jgi:hypothetical protein
MDGPKHDIRGFWPGMEEKEFKAKADAALRCEREQDATIDCKGSDGEYRFLFTREITPRLIKEVRLYFKSGAEAHEMAELLSQQFGAQPSERDETLDWPNRTTKQPNRTTKQPEDKRVSLAVNGMFSAFGMRLTVAKWKLPGWYVLELSGAESYLLTLVSMAVIDREARARQERVDREENARRLLNAKPKF